ncbi:hypothetical protein CRYUN_Cryun12cG0101200 [Craigia yunnanensis]
MGGTYELLLLRKDISQQQFLLQVHAEGPAHPIGGAAAIAKLHGPNAPVAFESKFSMSHAYDFYKPNLASEYPLVKKSFARLFFNDFIRNKECQASQQIAKHLYDSKVQPSTLLPKQVGNMYTASFYAAFASLLHNKHNSLVGKGVVMFSYGSGLTATIFSLKLQDGQHPFKLFNIAAVMNVSKKLKLRHEDFFLLSSSYSAMFTNFSMCLSCFQGQEST